MRKQTGTITLENWQYSLYQLAFCCIANHLEPLQLQTTTIWLSSQLSRLAAWAAHLLEQLVSTGLAHVSASLRWQLRLGDWLEQFSVGLSEKAAVSRTARLPTFLTAGVKEHPQLLVASRYPLALNGKVLPSPMGPGLQAGCLTVWCRLPSGAQEGWEEMHSCWPHLAPSAHFLSWEATCINAPHTWVLFCQALLSETWGVCLLKSPRC